MADMIIRSANMGDLPILADHDRHISSAELENLIRMGRVAIAQEDSALCGWMRWNLFWDNTPFLNMLYILEPFQGKWYGRKMMTHWETEMNQQGFGTVMTSTASDEYAQHFYRKLGYSAIGGFTPFDEPYELIFAKKL